VLADEGAGGITLREQALARPLRGQERISQREEGTGRPSRLRRRAGGTSQQRSLGEKRESAARWDMVGSARATPAALRLAMSPGRGACARTGALRRRRPLHPGRLRGHRGREVGQGRLQPRAGPRMLQLRRRLPSRRSDPAGLRPVRRPGPRRRQQVHPGQFGLRLGRPPSQVRQLPQQEERARIRAGRDGGACDKEVCFEAETFGVNAPRVRIDEPRKLQFPRASALAPLPPFPPLPNRTEIGAGPGLASSEAGAAAAGAPAPGAGTGLAMSSSRHAPDGAGVGALGRFDVGNRRGGKGGGGKGPAREEGREGWSRTEARRRWRRRHTLAPPPSACVRAPLSPLVFRGVFLSLFLARTSSGELCLSKTRRSLYRAPFSPLLSSAQAFNVPQPHNFCPPANTSAARLNAGPTARPEGSPG
jgi:hypothetical protein